MGFLRSSGAPVLLAAAVVAAVAAGAAIPAPAYGQTAAVPDGAAVPAVRGPESVPETSRVAVLERGPYPARGIRFLEPNSLSVWEAVYRLGERSIDVAYTREPIVPSATWETVRCGDRRLYRIPGSADDPDEPETDALHYRDSDGWSLFFSFPEGMEDRCAFVDRFFQRFLYFMSISASEYDHPFPAVIRP